MAMCAERPIRLVPDTRHEPAAWRSWCADLASALAAGESLEFTCSEGARIPVAAIGAWQAAVAAGDGWRFAAPEHPQAAALMVLAGRPPAGEHRPLPLSCTGQEPDTLRVRPRSAVSLTEPAATWIRGVACETIVLDFGEVEHVSSMLINWALQLRDYGELPRIKVVEAPERVVHMLQHLRLDRLLEV